MRFIVLSYLFSVAPPYFSTLSHESYDFRKNLLNIKCVLRFSTTFSEIFLILRRFQRDIVCLGFHVQYPLFVSLIILQLSVEIFEKYKNTKFHENSSSEIRIVPSRWMDGQTDKHDKFIIAWSNFAKAHKKV